MKTKEVKDFLKNFFIKKQELDEWMEVFKKKEVSTLSEQHLKMLKQHQHLSEILDITLKFLTEEELKIIRMTYIEQLTNIQLAESLNVSLSTASKRKRESSMKLAKKIQILIQQAA